MKINWDEKEKKNEARKLLLSNLPPKKSVILMPGYKLKCFKTGFETKAFYKDTKFILAERQTDTAKVIADATSNNKNVLLHVGELSSLRPNRLIDFAFLDFIGPLTKEDTVWMKDYLVPKLENGSDLAITLLYCYRNSHFTHECDTFFDKFGVAAYKWSFDTRLGDPIIHLYQCVIRQVLAGYSFEWKTPLYYRDKSPMTVLRLGNIRYTGVIENEEIFKSFWNFVRGNPTPLALPLQRVTAIEESIDVGGKASNMARNAAAIKAWATRRAKAEKRSEAARKAWRTRRARAA